MVCNGAGPAAEAGRVSNAIRPVFKSLSGEQKLRADSRIDISAWARRLAYLPAFAIATAVAADTLSDHVRLANDRFKDVAVAVSEGYTPIPCASGIDGGAMGVHYVNASLIGDSVDIKHPQAIMYEPKAGGRMELVAVEYIASKGPASLEGQLFNFTNAPNRYGLGPFYELHVWAWKANPHGTFADMNPTVSCEHAPMK